MAKKQSADDKDLLDELMSIRQLLDDELEGETAPSDNIPILNEVDNIQPSPPEPESPPDTTETDHFDERAEEAFTKNVQRGSPFLKPLTRDMLGENPFLPKQTLDKLNAQKAQSNQIGTTIPEKTSVPTDAVTKSVTKAASEPEPVTSQEPSQPEPEAGSELESSSEFESRSVTREPSQQTSLLLPEQSPETEASGLLAESSPEPAQIKPETPKNDYLEPLSADPSRKSSRRRSPRSSLSPEQQALLRNRLESEGELIVQEIVDEMIPALEADLRKRLHKHLYSLLDNPDSLEPPENLDEPDNA
ncbi:hypothetical protein MIB92_09525 [Aestuariirhabdus sp. Z084]|uniref:hypothetical protein n=1 Tax=Aestuariirhabdus haliotis TaxID=2918751 RepID=UPI00201B382A|nr:hypothetical protein [Aestuariirhabdus haliotis]MCL6415892.1 hypothetical protein [Aestuariirhabdus haliotis]MCL6419890.1 hypothetical protein [Aestuariirhabdus haliotis]